MYKFASILVAAGMSLVAIGLLNGCDGSQRGKNDGYSMNTLKAWDEACNNRQEDEITCICTIESIETKYTEPQFYDLMSAMNAGTISPNVIHWLNKSRDSCAIMSIEGR